MDTDKLQVLLDTATAGPWVYDPAYPLNAYSDDAAGSIVATVDGFRLAPRQLAEMAANAALIAVAPDLAAEVIRLRADNTAQVTVKPLDWKDGDRNGGFYAMVPIRDLFTGYYQITQEEFGLASVEFGIHCHEFGGRVVWKGPSAQAQAAAQSDHDTRIRAALDVAPVTLAEAARVPEIAALIEASRRASELMVRYLGSNGIAGDLQDALRALAGEMK